MRARTLRRRQRSAGRWAPRVRHPSRNALTYLNGPEADLRLRELDAHCVGARPLLGELAIALHEQRGHEKLGYRSLGDWSRERIGVGARTVREWARVGRALAGLPRLRRAVASREISWSVARLVVEHTTRENEAAVIETVRGRTVRAVELLLRAAFPRERSGREDAQRVVVRVPCSPDVATKWVAALELARRMAGEPLPVPDCAEAIVAECASAMAVDEAARSRVRRQLDEKERRASETRGRRGAGDRSESGFAALVWPHLRGSLPPAGANGLLERLGRGLEECSPLELDRRFRQVVSFLQDVNFERGRLLRRVLEQRLYCELGFESFEHFVKERLELSPSTARRLVRLARAERSAPALVSAFREGRITLMQALVLLRGEGSEADVRFAQWVTLRRLEDELPQTDVELTAPREVAELFLAFVRSVGLEAMLDHALATWLEAGRQFVDYADFGRDGFRCTVPGCTRRRNLHSHHLRFRSACGADEPWNRTTLCAWHHLRGVHEGLMRIWGQAPDGLVYELGVGTYRSGDVRVSSPGRAAA